MDNRDIWRAIAGKNSAKGDLQSLNAVVGEVSTVRMSSTCINSLCTHVDTLKGKYVHWIVDVADQEMRELNADDMAVTSDTHVERTVAAQTYNGFTEPY